MKAHVLAVTPTYDDSVRTQYFRSWNRMVRDCIKHNIEVNSADVTLDHAFSISAFVSQARAQGVYFALKDATVTHLLCLDSDMGWPSELLPRLLAADKDIIGATYPKRAFLDWYSANNWVGHCAEDEPITPDGFRKAIFIGGGFMLIKRCVLEKMIVDYPERAVLDLTLNAMVYDFFPSGGGLAHYGMRKMITDDVGFCGLAQKSGFEVWADLKTPLTHTGPVIFAPGAMLDFINGTAPPGDEKAVDSLSV